MLHNITFWNQLRGSYNGGHKIQSCKIEGLLYVAFKAGSLAWQWSLNRGFTVCQHTIGVCVHTVLSFPGRCLTLTMMAASPTMSSV